MLARSRVGSLRWSVFSKLLAEIFMLPSWYKLMILAVQSQQVVWLRLAKLGAGGSRARREGRSMVSEKMTAARLATGRLMMGASLDRVVGGYRKKVRANLRRLSK